MAADMEVCVCVCPEFMLLCHLWVSAWGTNIYIQSLYVCVLFIWGNSRPLLLWTNKQRTFIYTTWNRRGRWIMLSQHVEGLYGPKGAIMTQCCSVLTPSTRASPRESQWSCLSNSINSLSSITDNFLCWSLHPTRLYSHIQKSILLRLTAPCCTLNRGRIKGTENQPGCLFTNWRVR